MTAADASRSSRARCSARHATPACGSHLHAAAARRQRLGGGAAAEGHRSARRGRRSPTRWSTSASCPARTASPRASSTACAATTCSCSTARGALAPSTSSVRAKPELLDSFLPADLAENGFWQGEDLDIDRKRKLVFLSLDPRHDDKDPIATGCPPDGSTRLPQCRSGVYVISFADPPNLRQVGGFTEVPGRPHARAASTTAGGCGPAAPRGAATSPTSGPFTEGERGDGRPVWVTDMRNPSAPEVYGQPIDLFRNDGATDYSHDIQVDEDGIAWTSGRGGVRGYATSGRHRDPATNTVRKARPWDPILVSGGGFAGGPAGVREPESMFMHNSVRPSDGGVPAEGVADGNVLVATEEEFNDDCRSDGRLVFADLTSLVGRRGGAELDAGRAVPDGAARLVASGDQHAGDHRAEHRLLGALLRRRRRACWRRPGTARASGARRRDARAPRQIGYFRVSPTARSRQPELARLGHAVPPRAAVGVRHGARRRGAARSRRRRPARARPAGRRSRRTSRRTARRRSGSRSRTTSGLVCPLFRDSAAARAAS